MRPGFIAAALVMVGASAAREILTGGRVAAPSATQPFVAALK